LEILHETIIYILKSIYTILPGVLANAAPMLVIKINFLNYPVDMNLKIKGKPLFGKNKTYRGLVSGVILSVLLCSIQYLIYRYTRYKNLTIYNFEEVNFLSYGFFLGLGVLLGDLFKSFFKRRLDINPGESFIPWDQIDCVLGGLVIGRIAWAYDLKFAVIIIVITFFLHIAIRHFAYYVGIASSKW